jgi:hypothetical protein
MERVIGIGEHRQSRSVSEFRDNAGNQVVLCESVASALQEEHRDPNVREVLGAIERRPLRGMQRET